MADGEYHKLQALIVDDFDSFRVTVSKMLLEIGIEAIDSAVNGADALRHCKSKSYDLILCDHNLGKGKTGQQVLEDLRYFGYQNRHTLFVLISAESSKSIIMAAYDYEPDAYLTKPVTTRTLQQRLTRLFAQRAVMTPIYHMIEAEDFASAIAACQKHIASTGRYANHCQKLLGQLYLQIGEYHKAEQVYRDVLELRQLDWAQVGIARAKKAQGEYLAAQQWLDEAVATNPLCMKAYDLQAEIFHEQQRSHELQSVLQQAVEISPLSILRQQYLGDTALLNNDSLTATQAYRRAVRLGENSCYDRAENYTGLARATIALHKQSPIKAKPFLRDAQKALSELDQRFNKSLNTKTEVQLLEAQLFNCNGERKKAEEYLQLARTEMLKDDEQNNENLDIQIELVRALFALGKRAAGDTLVESLLQRYKGREDELQKLDRVLEEPVSEKNRSLVVAINKKGITFYKQNNFDAAIECFDNALQTFPNHIGIRLNLVQALADKLKLEFTASDLKLARDTLDYIETMITQAHDQHRRYLQLQDTLRRLEASRQNRE